VQRKPGARHNRVLLFVQRFSSIAATLGGTRGQPASAIPSKRLRKNNREGTEDNRRNPRKRQSSASDYAAFGTRDASGPTKAGSAAAPNRRPGANVMNTLLCKFLVTRTSEFFSYAAAISMPSCSQEFATSQTVARCTSRRQRRSSNSVPRCIVQRLSHITRSLTRQRWV
jgi:hypothetical protein